MPKFNSMGLLLQQVMSIMPQYCDRCGAKHLSSDTEIINNDPNKVTCKLQCETCKNAYIFQVMMPSDGIFNTRKSPLKVDIEGQEVTKFMEADIIENEEILDVFIDLKEINNPSELENFLRNQDKAALIN